MNGKKYFHVTESDILEHPVWVRAMDVATFRDDEDDDDWDDDPNLLVPLPDDPKLAETLLENCVCYARIRLISAHGRTFTGMIKCWAGDDVASLNPTVIIDTKQFDFYHGIRSPTAEEIAGTYSGLGCTAEELFPLSYALDVELPDGPPGGHIDGFSFLDSSGDRSIVQVIR